MKKYAKLIALILSYILILGLVAACNDDTPEASPTPEPTNDNGEETQEITTPPPPSPVEIDWHERDTINVQISLDQWGVVWGTGFGFIDDPLTQYLNEKFNIRIEAINGGGPEFQEELAARMADRDLPDIFNVAKGNPNLKNLYDANMLLEITQYMEQGLMPVVTNDNQFKAAMMIWQESQGWGNNLYAVPTAKGTDDAGNPSIGDFVRWDIYAEMGYPEIRTAQDLLNLLKDMQDAYPTNHNGQPAYGMGAWFGEAQTWADWSISEYANFREAYGGIGAFPWIVSYNKETLALNPNAVMTDPNGIFWSAMWFYNQGHQMGILDPESFIQSYDAWWEKGQNGQVHWLIPGWCPGAAQEAFIIAGFPEQGFGHIPAVGSDVQSLVTIHIDGNYLYCISADTADPERMVALIDYMQSYEFSRIAQNGIEGIAWITGDNGPEPLPLFYDINVDGPEKVRMSGMAIYDFIAGYSSATLDPIWGTTANLWDHPMSIEAISTWTINDIHRHFGTETRFDGYMSKLRVYEVINPYAPPLLPESMQIDYNHMYDFIFTNMFNVIRADSDDEFERLRDELIDGLARFNIDAMFDFVYGELNTQQAFAQQVLAVYHSG